VRAGQQQRAVPPGALLPDKISDDGQELVLAVLSRACHRAWVAGRIAGHHLVQVRALAADVDEGGEGAAQLLGRREGAPVP